MIFVLISSQFDVMLNSLLDSKSFVQIRLLERYTHVLFVSLSNLDSQLFKCFSLTRTRFSKYCQTLSLVKIKANFVKVSILDTSVAAVETASIFPSDFLGNLFNTSNYRCICLVELHVNLGSITSIADLLIICILSILLLALLTASLAFTNQI